MVNLKKKQKAETISQIIKKNPNFVLLQLGKISHKQLEEIRKSLLSKGKLMVIKNSLFEKAFNKLLKENQLYQEIKKKFFPLKNQNATVFINKDWFEILKVISNFLKKDFSFKLNFAHLDGQIYDEIAIKKLAALPEKNILLAKLINQIKMPIYRLTHTLNYPLSKLVYVLKNKKVNS